MQTLNDRELVERCAEILGIHGEFHEYYGGDYYYHGITCGIVIIEPYTNTRVWNPLLDDGDALRVAVQLNLLTKHRFLDALSIENESCNDDYCLATRRAIVITSVNGEQHG